MKQVIQKPWCLCKRVHKNPCEAFCRCFWGDGPVVRIIKECQETVWALN